VVKANSSLLYSQYSASGMAAVLPMHEHLQRFALIRPGSDSRLGALMHLQISLFQQPHLVTSKLKCHYLRYQHCQLLATVRLTTLTPTDKPLACAGSTPQDAQYRTTQRTSSTYSAHCTTTCSLKEDCTAYHPGGCPAQCGQAPTHISRHGIRTSTHEH
jgi:hypothetical protein